MPVPPHSMRLDVGDGVPRHRRPRCRAWAVWRRWAVVLVPTFWRVLLSACKNASGDARVRAGGLALSEGAVYAWSAGPSGDVRIEPLR